MKLKKIAAAALLSFGASLAQADTVQMELPLAGKPDGSGRESAALDQAVDDVRSRFGEGVIKRASMIDADQGVPVPTLED